MMNQRVAPMQKSQLSDEELALAAQKGNQESFVLLYERFFPSVYSWVRFKVQETDVDDVTQEVFIAVLKSLESFRGQSKFNTWIWTITTRKIADYHRSSKAAYIDQNEFDDAVKNYEADPSHNPDTQDDLRVIRQAISTLPSNYQDILRQRFIEDLPFQDIARKNGQTLEAVKSLFRRAVTALNAKLEQVNG